MAEREDSIHIKIKMDIAAEDREFANKLSVSLEKADQQNVTLDDIKEGDFEEYLQDEIQKIERTIIEKTEDEILNTPEIKQLKEDIEKLQKELKQGTKDPEVIKQKLETKRNNLLLKQFKEGNVGQLNDFTESQFRNLKQVISNPIQFMMAAFGKKIGKAAMAGGRAGPIGIFVALILIIAKDLFYVLFNELTKPGRPLDRRFKRIARLEVQNFYDRQLQEEIRHGYAEVRVTTRQGLRGGASQVGGGYFEFSIGTTGLNSSAARSSQTIYQSQNSHGNTTDKNGSPRRRTVSGRFG